ncbi:MAG: twin-arginine translocase TatA/TatE family subunit [Leptospiraceae bacterium]|nr:twin-arginine translocase TatA/TatE family subunit [Leptospiraceae bacterium]MDW7975967.1 twin-arginine translocase TatA/TatE family subunit [Leptospiraceae bacterium]
MKTLLFIGSIGGTELIIILIIVLLIFGGRKIPQLARDIGLGIKEFRKSISSTEEPNNSPQQLTYEEEPQTPKAKKTVQRKKKA